MTGDGCTPVKLPTTTIQSVYRKSSLYITLPVNTVPTVFLADSGAEISVLPDGHASIPSGSELQPVKLQPIGVDGKPLEVLGTVMLSVAINDSLLDVNFYIARSVSPILGVDVMKRFRQVCLDFDNHTVKFGTPGGEGKPEPVVAPRLCRVVLQEDTLIPGRQEILVGGMLEDSSPSLLQEYTGQTCLLESVLT